MDLPRPRPFALQLLDAGIPTTLLLDLVDVDGLRSALAAELAELDVARAQLPTPTARALTA